MDPDHVTLVRTVYAAFARGDAPAVLGAFAPDIHWNEAEAAKIRAFQPFTDTTQFSRTISQ
jgi:ketosteroid isomerase-like protein